MSEPGWTAARVLSEPRPPLPLVALVHGAGLGPDSFDAMARQLREQGLPTVVVVRRGYDDRAATADLDRHVDDLLGVIEGRPAIVVGVSGGATLALALALRNVASVRHVIAHEPLLGPLAPVQHALITTSIEKLLNDSSPAALERFVERLLTPDLWHSLDPGVRSRIVDRAEAVRTEAPGFASFTVSTDQLARRTTPLTWTVGGRSPGWRHDAARVASENSVSVRILPAAHTPQLECATAAVELIADVIEHGVGA